MEGFIHSFCCLSFTGPLLVLLASSESSDSLPSDTSVYDFASTCWAVDSVVGVCFSLIAGREGLCKIHNKHSVYMFVHSFQNRMLGNFTKTKCQ